MAIPLLPSGISFKKVGSSVFGGNQGSQNVQGVDPAVKQQLLQQSKQFAQTQQQNQVVITNIQQQFQALQNQINVLATGINNIAKLIQNDTVSEQNLLKQQQDQERRFSLRKIRIGRENKLEERIQAALSGPVQEASSKLESIFSRVGRALQIMFFGFLGVQALKAIRAWQDGDYERLGEIKDLILENIGYAIAAIAAIKFGLPLVGVALRGLVSKVGSLLFGGIKTIFKSVGSKIGSFLGGVGSAITRPFSGSAPKASTAVPSAPKSGTSSAPKVSPKPNAVQRALGAAGKGLRRFGGPLVQGTLGTVFDIATGEDPGRALAGAATGVTVAAPAAAVGSLLGPLGSFGAGVAGYSYGADFGKNLYDKFFGKPQDKGEEPTGNTTKPTSSSPPSSSDGPSQPPQTVVSDKTGESSQSVTPPSSPKSDTDQQTNISEPKSTMMPSASELTVNVSPDKSKEEDYLKYEEKYWNSIADGLESGSSYEDLDLNKEQIDYLEGRTEAPPMLTDKEINKVKEMETPKDVIKSGAIENKPPTIPQIRPLEEPTPNVIVTSPQSQKTSAGQGPPGQTDVPLIPSANPDNFYVLYSKLNYNVVM